MRSPAAPALPRQQPGTRRTESCRQRRPPVPEGQDKSDAGSSPCPTAAPQCHQLPEWEAEPARGSARISLPKEQLLCLIRLPPCVCHLNNLSVFCSSQGLGRGCKECLEINRPCCVSRQGASPGFVSQPNPVPEPGIRNFVFPEDKEPQQTEQLWGFCKVQHRKTTVEINRL